MRRMKRTLALLSALAALLLSACGSSPPRPFLASELHEAWLTEVRGGAASDLEVSLPELVGVDELLPAEGFRPVKKAPEPEGDYLLFRFVQTDGQTRLVRMFTEGKNLYLSEDGVGAFRILREKLDSPATGDLGYARYEFLSRNGTLGLVFLSGAERYFRTSLALPEELLAPMRQRYDGAGKAVWLDLASDGRSTRDLGEWSYHIPPERQALRVEDVRYLFVLTRAGVVYDGYWVRTDTGEKIFDDYDYRKPLTVYDLLTGEISVLQVFEKYGSGYEEPISAFLASAP